VDCWFILDALLLAPLDRFALRRRIRAMLVAVAVTGGAAGCSPSGVCPDPADGSEVLEASVDSSTTSAQSFNVPSGPATTIPLTGCAGPGYAATFTVGSQPFQLTLDTGSGTVAVAAGSCSNCGVSPTYTPGASAVDQHASVTDSYLMGSWQGDVVTDSVQLAGTGSVTMNIAAIASQSGFFSDAGCGLGAVPFAPQGIAGLGPPGLARPGTDAFVTKLRQVGAAANVMAFEFCGQGGQLMMGAVDPVAAALTGPAVYTPMTSSQYYGVTLDDLRVGGTSLGFGAADFGVVAVDTGTSVLALPGPVFDALASNIEGMAAFVTAFGGQSHWLGTTACLESSFTAAELDAMLPPLTLAFPGADAGAFAVTLNATASYLVPTSSNGATFYCSGVVQNPNASGSILGTSIMAAELVIFDLDTNAIGFAPQTFCE
jgi:hypothetical protein